jgi:hypothetical protein
LPDVPTGRCGCRPADCRTNGNRNDEVVNAEDVATGICEDQRIVADVAVAVQRLRITGAWDDAIRLREPSEFGVVVPGVVVIQPGGFVEDLAGVAVADGERQRVVLEPLFAERRVLVMLDEISLAVGEDVRRAEACPECFRGDRRRDSVVKERNGN